jgi:UDP-N-acetylglucosamine 4,6-dehydratase
VRYGNVLGSRGSVIPFFKEMALQGQIPITDLRMTRFWLTLDQGVDLVLTALENMEGGEIFVPKIPSFKVSDVARLVAPNTPTHLIGIRPGEKLHEIMITEDDSYYTLEYNDYYTILSPHQYGIRSNSAPRVPEGFSYRSDSNSLWFTDESFMETLKKANLI